MKNSAIEWTDHTFNPWIGCTKVSPACDHCYAEALMDKRMHRVTWGAGQPRVRTSAQNWNEPLRWNAECERTGTRARVFCASLADVFDNEAPAEWRAALFALIAGTPHLDWLLLTKRIGNVKAMIEAPGMQRCGLPPNVWLGATVVNQAEADRDIPKLLAVPAAKRFLSIEPMLGPINLERWTLKCCGHREINDHGVYGQEVRCCGNPEPVELLDWVICGGESGHHARPMHPRWAQSLRDQCQAAGVPYLFKQWGEWLPAGHDPNEPQRWAGRLGGTLRCYQWPDDQVMMRVGKAAAGRLLDGRTWDEVPQ